MSVFPQVECRLRSPEPSYPAPEIPTAEQGRLEEMRSCKTHLYQICVCIILSVWDLFSKQLSLCLRRHLKFAFGLLIMGVWKFSTWFFFKIMNFWVDVCVFVFSFLSPPLPRPSNHSMFLTFCLFCLRPNIPSDQFGILTWTSFQLARGLNVCTW